MTTSSNSQLIEAIKDQQVTLVKQLLLDGADPNFRASEDDPYPLQMMHCYDRMYEAIVQLLLEAGADPNKNAPDFASALYNACVAKSLPLVKLLLSAGADPNGACTDGNTPLRIACSDDDTAMATTLLNAGAQTEILGRYAVSTLEIACLGDNYKCVELLIARGADTSSAMDRALSWCPHIEGRTVSLLLRAGRDMPWDLPWFTDHGVDLVKAMVDHNRIEFFSLTLDIRTAFICGSHPRLGADSPVSLLLGFPSIMEFIILSSIPPYLLADDCKPELP